MRFDFFESWLMFGEVRPPAKNLDEYIGFLMKDLARLEEYLDNPVPRRTLMDYLPVAARVAWFRREHPDCSIITKCVQLANKAVIMKAIVKNAEGRIEE